MAIRVKTGYGTWKNVAAIRVKTAYGTWKNVTRARVKTAYGTWKDIFGSNGSNIQTKVTISKSLNSPSNIYTLTGTNYYWSPIPDSLSYSFDWFDGVSWVSIDSGVATNPSSGSSNTYTTVVNNTSSEILPNTINNYRFVVSTVYNNQSGTSTSANESINVPYNITTLVATKNTSNPGSKIDLSGYSSTNANNYKIYTKNASADWVYHSTVSTTSTTITIDSPNQSDRAYSIKIIPITGNESYVGYSGNESNIASVTLDALPVFSITSASKSGMTLTQYGYTTTVSAEWGPYTGATKYQYRIESSSDGITWTNATTGVSYTQINYGSTFETTSTSISGIGLWWQKYMRISVRALNSSGTVLAYADNNPYTVSFTSPSTPTITESSKTSTSITFAWSVSSPGSNTLSDIEYKLGNGSWVSGGTSSPITISSLSASTQYTIYARAKNNDDQYSGISTGLTVTTSAANATAPTSVTATMNGKVATVSWSGATGATNYRIYWLTTNSTSANPEVSYDAQTTGSSTVVTLPSYSTTYYFFVSATSGNGNWTPYNNAVSSGYITGNAPSWTVTWNANGGSVSPTSSVVTQGNSVTAPTPTRSGYTFNGWYDSSSGGSLIISGGTSYTPSSNITLYAQWTVVFTAPSSGAPSWTSSNFQRITSSSVLRWYTDYPPISGDGSFSGMQFEIRTTAGGGTLLASGTRTYPGDGQYPYFGGGTYWAFKMGTETSDISYSSSARYGRVRTVMLGTNGTTYYGTWSGWI